MAIQIKLEFTDTDMIVKLVERNSFGEDDTISQDKVPKNGLRGWLLGETTKRLTEPPNTTSGKF